MSNLITKISLWQTLDKFWHWEVVRYSGQDHHSSYVVASGVVPHRDDGFEPTKNTAWGRAALSAFGRAAASAQRESARRQGSRVRGADEGGNPGGRVLSACRAHERV